MWGWGIAVLGFGGWGLGTFGGEPAKALEAWPDGKDCRLDIASAAQRKST